MEKTPLTHFLNFFGISDHKIHFSFSISFMFLCIYHMCVGSCVGAEVNIWYLSESLFTLFLETNIFPNMKLVNSLPTQKTIRTCILHSSEVTDACHYTWLLYAVAGNLDFDPYAYTENMLPTGPSSQPPKSSKGS